MRILVGWNNDDESKTVDAFLNVDEYHAEVFTDIPSFTQAAVTDNWDVILFPLSFPSPSELLPLFQQVQSQNNGVPIIGIWRPDEIAQLAQLISHGLHSHLMRDADGHYMFLFATMVDAAHASVQAQRSKLLAERLRQEVDSVRKLQETVIPSDLPEPNGYRVAARYEPSQIRIVGNTPVTMAGGDYYEVFELDDDTLVMLVGDASGHGVKACMSIMTMHTLIRMIQSNRYADTASFVAEVNQRLCSSEIVQDEGGFITLLYCALDLKRHHLQWTAAGAPMPLLQDLASGDIVPLGSEENGGLPLAVEEDWRYQSMSFDLPKNSRLLIYTDGLEEAFPEGGDETNQFGVDGIVASLRSSANLPVERALEKLFDDSHSFTSGQGRLDDTSIVLLERQP